MASYYTIAVRNLSSTTQYFYVFQKQAFFQPVSASPVLSASLGCQAVGNYPNSGAQISFSLSAATYVGAVSTAAPPAPPQAMAFSRRSRSVPPTSTKAIWPIDLTSDPSGNSLNSTKLTVSPLGLSMPANKQGISVGAFAITVPPYTPTPKPEVYCGVATMTADGAELLSSFVAPPPNSTVTCTPEQIFFVANGYMPEGDTIAYDESYAACCDFTTGYTRITVTYNADGTFSTSV